MIKILEETINKLHLTLMETQLVSKIGE